MGSLASRAVAGYNAFVGPTALEIGLLANRQTILATAESVCVLLIGDRNVGKSSLANMSFLSVLDIPEYCSAGDVASVSCGILDLRAMTTDVRTHSCQFRGQVCPIRFVDTPGFFYTSFEERAVLPHLMSGVQSGTVIFPPEAQQIPQDISNCLQLARDQSNRARAVVCVVSAPELQGAKRPDGFFDVAEKFDHYAEIVKETLTHLTSRPYLIVTKMDLVKIKPESVIQYFGSLGFDLNGIILTTLYHRSTQTSQPMSRSAELEAPILSMLASIVAKAQSGTH